MDAIVYRKPVKMSELVMTVAKELIDNEMKPTSRHNCPDTEFCIFTKQYVESCTSDLICYLDYSPNVTNDGEEEFSEFVLREGLKMYCNGQLLEDVIYNILIQNVHPSAKVLIDALNHYMAYDAFLVFD